MRYFRLTWFHVRQFTRTTFFLQTLIITTISAVLTQVLFLHSASAMPDARELVWIRAGIMGSWTMTCMAVGILGFQRFQGVLSFHVFSPLGTFRALLPCISSSVVFGLAAFVLSAATSFICRLPVYFYGVEMLLILVMFFLASLACACVMALFFLLTPNALTYESLAVIPIILLSGVYAIHSSFSQHIHALSFLVPFSFPVRLLTALPNGENPYLLNQQGDITLWVISMVVWFASSVFLMKKVVQRVQRLASLEVM